MIGSNLLLADVIDWLASLKVPLPGVVDGASLVDENAHKRPRKTMHFDYDQVTMMNPEFPQRFNYVDRMLTAFWFGKQ